MRTLIAITMLSLGIMSSGAFADEPVTTGDDAAPQCQSVQVDGRATLACFNLSEDQVATMGGNQDPDSRWRRCWRVCNVRVIGPCLVWHTVCR